MSQFVPDWSSNMGDAFAPLCGEDDGPMELLWCNGHVVMQSQAPRKPPPRPEKPPAPTPATMLEDEAAPWFQYPADDGSLEKDLFSEIFGGMPAEAGRTCKEEEEERGAVTALRSGLMPPPTPGPERVLWEKAGLWDEARGALRVVPAATEAGESSSVVTVGSRSICGSNHVQTPGAARAHVVSDTARDGAPPPIVRNRTSIPARSQHDASTTVTSSSMPSRPPGATSRSCGGKRKQHDTAECPSEDVESESGAVTCEPAQKLTTAKRRRAAEVHNLSERRRRDRINEKMKALQELIPHCNKTDKASMLDEAIEYLKSLQLQLQMMWMGSGGMAPAPATAPVMFPAGVHQYMQRMASMPRMPPFMAAKGPPASHLPAAVGMAADSYARCLAVEHLQPPPSPMGMGFYQLGAAKNLQQNPGTPPPVVPCASLPAATARRLPADALHKNYCVKSSQAGDEGYRQLIGI